MHSNIKQNTLKTWTQHGMRKLHVKPRFHIEHAPNGATVQHIHPIQVSNTICPKQQLSTLQSRKRHATVQYHSKQKHGIKVHVKHGKT